MAKKVKHYVGDVHFDVWGNLQEQHGIHTLQICDDNIDMGDIWLDKWDDVSRQQVKKRIFYTPDELNIKFYDQPKPRSQWDYNNGKGDYIAEIQSGVAVPNYVFSDTLEYDTHYYGRSSTCFYVKSHTDNKVYRVFLKDLDLFIRKMDKGIITGDFTFCKKGYKFGIKPV